MINVLDAALSVLPKQQITYNKFSGDSINDLGICVPSYEDAMTITCSLQPAGTDVYYKYGIASNEDVFVCWLKIDALTVSQMQSNDLITDASGNVYNIFRCDDWSSYPNQDWNKILIKRAKNYDN